MSLMPKTEQSSTAKQMAEQLRHALRQANLLQRAASISGWTAEFILLLKKHTEAEIQPILDWYCKNVNKHPMIPKAYSARSFRLRFNNISIAKRISEDKGNVSTIKVSDRAAALARRLKLHCAWPKLSDHNLPQLVELSLQRLQRFSDVVRAYAIHFDKNGKEIVPPDIKWGSKEYWNRRFAMAILDAIRGLDDFVYEWFARQSRRYSGWVDWNGHLKPIRIDALSFQREMATVAWNRASSNQPWFDLWDAIKENL